MLSPFFALAAQSPTGNNLCGARPSPCPDAGRNRLAMTQMTPAAGRQLLGSVALVAASSKGDAAGWRLTQLPKSQALEFLL